jgi:hypothetical protein
MLFISSFAYLLSISWSVMFHQCVSVIMFCVRVPGEWLIVNFDKHKLKEIQLWHFQKKGSS